MQGNHSFAIFVQLFISICSTVCFLCPHFTHSWLRSVVCLQLNKGISVCLSFCTNLPFLCWLAHCGCCHYSLSLSISLFHGKNPGKSLGSSVCFDLADHLKLSAPLPDEARRQKTSLFHNGPFCECDQKRFTMLWISWGVSIRWVDEATNVVTPAVCSSPLSVLGVFCKRGSRHFDLGKLFPRDKRLIDNRHM